MRIELAMTLDTDLGDPDLERIDGIERLLNLLFFADDPDQVVHHLLQFPMQRVGVLANPTARRLPERCEGALSRRLHEFGLHLWNRVGQGPYSFRIAPLDQIPTNFFISRC